MSAGATDSRLSVHRDLDELAPRFRAAVKRAVAECHARGLDAWVYEAYRTQELQSEYYSRGRTRIPPLKTVTNAPDNLSSWHGYGLAVDVISRSKHWNAGTPWFREVAAVFKAHECKWGGDWRSVDLPHFQWHKCKASPSPEARRLLATEGVQAVWRAVGAMDGDTGVMVPPLATDDRETGAATSSGAGARVAIVTASALRLRHDPSTGRREKRLLPQGTRVEVLEAAGAWYRVRVDDQEGFVHGDHIAEG